MPTRKTKTITSKTSRPLSGSLVPYGPPIRDAIARGDIQEMRKVATSARKWIKEVEAALQKLEQRIAQTSLR